MINKVILVGNLGADPEVRYAQNGSAVANLSVATSESWIDKSTGQKQEKTEWHRVVIFGKLAEIAAQYLVKGSQVYLEGKLQTRKWQDKNTGQDRYSTEIVLDFNGVMQMLGGKKGGGDSGGYQAGGYAQAQRPAQGGYQQPQQAQQMQQSMQQQPQRGNYQQPVQRGGNMAYPNPAHQPQQPQYAPNDFDDDVPF